MWKEIITSNQHKWSIPASKNHLLANHYLIYDVDRRYRTQLNLDPSNSLSLNMTTNRNDQTKFVPFYRPFLMRRSRSNKVMSMMRITTTNITKIAAPNRNKSDVIGHWNEKSDVVRWRVHWRSSSNRCQWKISLPWLAALSALLCWLF